MTLKQTRHEAEATCHEYESEVNDDAPKHTVMIPKQHVTNPKQASHDFEATSMPYCFVLSFLFTTCGVATAAQPEPPAAEAAVEADPTDAVAALITMEPT